jgi:hypothetical protein
MWMRYQGSIFPSCWYRISRQKRAEQRSKEALAAWVKAEDAQQQAFHKDLLTGSMP